MTAPGGTHRGGSAGPPLDAYAAAGVDIAAGERAVELMKSAVARAQRPEVLGGLGGFAGLFRLDLARWTAPVLAASTDGAGTKTALAVQLGRYDTIGIDVVAMVVDDLVVCGAEPLLVQDYIAVGKLDPATVATIVAGVATGCQQSGAALLGGETAEHPGLMAADEFDIAATAVGLVEADAILGPDRVRAGDCVVALGASGLHANGYSLVRSVLASSGADLHTPLAGADATLGAALLEPTRIYAGLCLAAAAALPVHAYAHVTGGGLVGNLGRVIPAGLTAVVDRASWTPPVLVRWLADTGALRRDDVERTVNMGVGMLAVLAPAAAADLIALAAGTGVPAWVCGEVRDATAAVRREPAAADPGAADPAPAAPASWTGDYPVPVGVRPAS